MRLFSPRNTLYNVVFGLNSQPSINTTAMLVLDAVCSITLCTIMPRFIINVRELYDCDRQGVDSGFRVSPRPICRDTTVPAILFMDITAGQNFVEQFMDGSEMIQIEELGNDTRRV